MTKIKYCLDCNTLLTLENTPPPKRVHNKRGDVSRHIIPRCTPCYRANQNKRAQGVREELERIREEEEVNSHGVILEWSEEKKDIRERNRRKLEEAKSYSL